MKEIKVSVICMTYNQVKFIRQALDGFVMQKTNFPFEVLVHDDASTDGTVDIIREYAEKYPDIIKPIYQQENQYSQGVQILKKFIWPKIKGKYVAVCDGDDYWIDPLKLQKQVDFLDTHPDYALCFAKVNVFWDDNSQPETIWPRKVKYANLEHLVYGNFIPNCTVMYRWVNPTNVWPEKIYPSDWMLHMQHAKYGKIHFIPDVMARYRRQPQGISFAETQDASGVHLKYGIKEMNFFLAVENQIAPNKAEYHKYVCHQAREIVNAYALNGEFDKAGQVIKQCPDFLGEMGPGDRKQNKKYQYRFNKLLVVAIVELLIIIGMVIGVIL